MNTFKVNNSLDYYFFFLHRKIEDKNYYIWKLNHYNMSEQFAEVNGIKLCYEIHGEGDPVILIHGFGAKKSSWIAQVPELRKKYQVIILDNRGAGKSDRPSGEYTMELFADDIAGLMDYLNIQKAKAVIGWSLGGMIVQHFLLKHQDRVEKGVLLFTNYKGVGRELYQQSRHEGLDAMKEDHVKAWWDGSLLSFHRSFRKELLSDPKKKHHGIWSAEDLIADSIVDPPTHEDIDNQAVALSNHNTLDNLGEITIPVLLVAASHDRLTPKITMEEMHEKIPNSTFKVIKKAGHGAPHSRTPEVNELILDFLSD